jgi:hypothetical protein
VRERVVRLGVNGYSPTGADLPAALVFSLTVPGDGRVLAAGVAEDGKPILWSLRTGTRRIFTSTLGALTPMAIVASGTSLFAYEPARCLLAEFRL